MGNDILQIILQAKVEASKVVQGAASTISGSFQGIGAAANKLAGGLAIVATAAAGAIGYGTKIAADLETSRQGFITLLGSAKLADAAIAMIKRDAAATPFELPGLIQANQLLTSVTKDAGKSESLLLNVGKALSAMGKGQPELDRIIVNLQQIGAVGHASALDIKQFAFAGIPIYELLTQATGKSGDALQALISDGGVTFDVLTKMFDKAGSAGGRFEKAFSSQAGTLNQLWSNLHDTVNISMVDFLKTSGLFDMIKEALAKAIPLIQQFGEWLSGTAVPAVRKFLSNRENIIGMLTVIGVLLGIVVVAFIAANWQVIALGLALVALGYLVSRVVKAWDDNFWGVRTTVEGLVKWFSGTFVPGIGNAITWVVDKAIWLKETWVKTVNLVAQAWTITLTTIATSAKTVFESIGRIIQNVWAAIWTVVGPIFNLFIGAWMLQLNIVLYVFAVIRGAAIVLWEFLWTTAIKPVLDLITAGIQAVGGAIVAVWQWIASVTGTIWNFIYTNVIAPVIGSIVAAAQWVGSVMAVVWGGVSAAGAAAWNWIASVWNRAVGFFGGIWSSLTNSATGAGNSIGNAIGGAIASAINSAKSVITTAVNWIVDKINSFVDGLNNTVGKLPGVPKLGHLPHFDNGGVVPGPIGSAQLIVAHGGETVLPTHKQSGNYGNQTINVYATINQDVDIETLGQKLAYYGKQMGSL
jgi:tape measure domain-containing protein